MHKLKLDPEMLRVESFTPNDDAAAARGTVDAHSTITRDMLGCTDGDNTSISTNHIYWTCGESCIYQCRPTGDDPACYS